MKRKTANLLTVMILAISITMIAYSITRVNAEGATIWTDKQDYSPAETVYIYGSFFLPNTSLVVNITRPDGHIDSSLDQGTNVTYKVTITSPNGETDADGNFTATYQLDGITGTYTVTATDGTNTATTTFTDAKHFTSTISPTTANAGETKTYNITITYIDTGNKQLGSANMSIPLGFTSISITSVTPPAGKSWNGMVSAGQIMLNATTANSDELDANESVSVIFSAKAPTTAGTYEWTTSAYDKTQWAKGGALLTLSGTQPTVTVSLVYVTVTSSPVTGAGFIKVDGSAITTPHAFGWVVGDTHQLEALSPVTGPTGTQYVWSSWNDSGDRTHDYAVPSVNQTVTANYKTQYNVTFAQSGLGSDASGTIVTVNGTAKAYALLPNSTWVDSGSSMNFSYATTVSSTTSGKQYVLTGVSGNATSSPLTVNGAVMVTGAYKVQWKVTFAQSGLNAADAQGTVVTVFGSAAKTVGLLPNVTWVDDGSSVSFSYSAIVSSSVSGKQYVLTGVSGNTTASSVAVSSAVTVTGTYKVQWKVTFNSAGLDASANGNKYLTVNGSAVNYPSDYSLWVNSSDVLEFSYENIVESSTVNKRFILGGVDAPSPLTVTNSVTVTGIYKTQWMVFFAQSGLDGTATGTVVTINGTGKVFGDLTFSEWVNSSDNIEYYYASVIASITANKQFRLTDVSGPASVFTVTKSETVTGNYVVQWKVIITQRGLDGSASGTVVTINSSTKAYGNLPNSTWVDNGDTIVYSYEGIITSFTPDMQFRLKDVTGLTSPITVTGPVTVTGNYVVQWYVTFDENGLDISANTNVVTINGTAKTYGLLPNETWVDSGDTIEYSYGSIVGSSTVNKQFRLDSVTGAASPITVSGPVTVRGNYIVQWYVTITQTGLDGSASTTVVTVNASAKIFAKLPNSTWVDNGDKIQYSYEGIVGSSVAGKQFRLTGVTGLTSIITVTSSVTVTGNYVTQWYVSFTQAGLDSAASGTIVTVNASAKTYTELPNSTWVDSGDKIVFGYEAIVASTTPSMQFALKSVSGPSSPITVSSAVTVTGNYVVQWNVTFAQTSLDGTASGTVVTVNGTDYTYSGLSLSQWVNDSDTIVYSYQGIVASTMPNKQFKLKAVTGPLTGFTVTTPVTVTGNYVVQWNVTFAQNGLDNTASSTIVTINGTAKIYGQLPNSTWVDSGDKIEYSYESIIDSSTANKQFALKNVTGLASLITVSSGVTVTGNYVVQWNVTFTQTGVGTDFSGTVMTVNLTDYNRAGYSAWTDDGSIYNFDFKSPLAVSAGKQYVFVSVNATSGFTVSTATTVTGSYKTQYWIVFRQNGVGVDFSGTVMTVNGTVHDRDGYSAWTDSGDVYSFAYSTPLLAAANEKRYVLTGVNETSGFTVSGFETVTGVYKTQFWIVFDTSGVSGDYSAADVFTVNGTGYDRLGTAFWADDNSPQTFAYASPLLVHANQKQYVLTSVNETSVLTVSKFETVTGTYKTQWNVTFAQSGVGSDFSGTVVVIDSVNYGRSGASFWWYDTSTHSFAFQSPLTVNGGKRYVWDTTIGISNAQSDPSLKVTGSGSVTGNYKTQYYLTNTLIADSVNSITPSQTSDSWYDDGTDVYVVLNYVWGASSTTRSNLFSYAIDASTTNVPRAGSGTLAVPKITMDTFHSVSDASVTQYYLKVSTNPTVLTPQPTVSKTSGYTTGDGYWDVGSVVSVDPGSPAGYTFDHWSGDASGSTAPLSVTMTSSKTIVAVYRFNLTVETGFKPGDSPSFASDPYLANIMCVLVKTTGGYRLVGTAPGTFDYAIAIKNTGATTFNSITITVNGHTDFCLQSSNPIRVLDATGNVITSQFTISGTWPTITISSNALFTGLQGSKSLYVTIHLDYALKGNIFTSQLYTKGYTFHTTITGTNAPNTGTNDAYGFVTFLSKKTTVIYGYVKTSSGAPIQGATVQLALGSTIYTDVTDADGFYCFINGVNDVNSKLVSLSGAVAYTLTVTLPDSTILSPKTATAQTDTAVQVIFTKDQK